jgi:hypothetical protein
MPDKVIPRTDDDDTNWTDEELDDLARVDDATLADAKADARRHDDLAAFLEADQVDEDSDE